MHMAHQMRREERGADVNRKYAFSSWGGGIPIPCPTRKKKPNSPRAASICAATWSRHGSPTSNSDRSMTGKRGSSIQETISFSG
jgi:hypothetical protein